MTAQTSSDEGWTRIWMQWRRALYGQAMRFHRGPEFAEEMLSRTAEKFWKFRDQYKGQSKISTYLYSIMRNECLMAVREEKKNAAGMDSIATLYHHLPPSVEDLENLVAAKHLLGRLILRASHKRGARVINTLLVAGDALPINRLELVSGRTAPSIKTELFRVRQDARYWRDREGWSVAA